MEGVLLGITARWWRAIELRMMGCKVRTIKTAMGCSATRVHHRIRSMTNHLPYSPPVALICVWLECISDEERQAFYNRCARIVQEVPEPLSQRSSLKRTFIKELATCDPAHMNRAYFAARLHTHHTNVSRMMAELANRLGLPRRLEWVWLVYWGAAQAKGN